MKPTKILLLGHPSYTLPATIDVNSSGLVIDHTLKYAPVGFKIWALSPYKDIVSQHAPDPAKYHYYHTSDLPNRILLKLLTVFSLIKEFSGLTNLYKNYLVAILIECFRTRPDIIVVHTTKLPWAALVSKICKRSKVVIYQHNSEMDTEFKAELHELKGLAGHIFVSDFAKQQLLRAVSSDHTLFSHCSATAMVVKNGVDTELFKPLAPEQKKSLLARLNIPDDSFIIIFCGRLAERKGPHLLIEAYQGLPLAMAQKTYLLMVGSDDYNTNTTTDYIADLHTKAAANDQLKNNILFTGVLKNEVLSSYYGISDVMVFPSIDLEGLPLVPLEAQATGAPVIASKIGGTAECIRDGVTGYFIENITATKLREQLIEFMQKPVSERNEMKLNARRFIENGFTEAHMAQQFYHHIAKL